MRAIHEHHIVPTLRATNVDKAKPCSLCCCLSPHPIVLSRRPCPNCRALKSQRECERQRRENPAPQLECDFPKIRQACTKKSHAAHLGNSTFSSRGWHELSATLPSGDRDEICLSGKARSLRFPFQLYIAVFPSLAGPSLPRVCSAIGKLGEPCYSELTKYLGMGVLEAQQSPHLSLAHPLARPFLGGLPNPFLKVPKVAKLDIVSTQSTYE